MQRCDSGLVMLSGVMGFHIKETELHPMAFILRVIGYLNKEETVHYMMVSLIREPQNPGSGTLSSCTVQNQARL